MLLAAPYFGEQRPPNVAVMNSEMQHMTSSNPEAQVDVNRYKSYIGHAETDLPLDINFMSLGQSRRRKQSHHLSLAAETRKYINDYTWTTGYEKVYLQLAHDCPCWFCSVGPVGAGCFPAWWESCGTRKFNCPVTTLNSKTWRHFRNSKQQDLVQRVKPENLGSPVPRL